MAAHDKYKKPSLGHNSTTKFVFKNLSHIYIVYNITLSCTKFEGCMIILAQ